MTEPLSISHWVFSQSRGEEPRCVKMIREYSRDEFWVYAECECGFEVGIARPRGRDIGVRADQYVPPADSRIESSATADMPF